MSTATIDSMNGISDDMSPATQGFTVLKTAAKARRGRFTCSGRRIVETPHYVGSTSRGVIPHITQDTFCRDTNINPVYLALEDFIERAPKDVPPVYKHQPPNGSSPLRSFVALSENALLVLGARRSPPVAAPPANSNTDQSVSICTAVGFRLLNPDDYAHAAEQLGADVVVALGDIPYERALGSKRIERATDRSIQWLENHAEARRSAQSDLARPKSMLFASLLPVSCARQQFLLETIANQLRNDVDGLAFFALEPLEDLPGTLVDLPRLSFTSPSTPLDALRHIAQGVDLLTIPFITSATDAGIALDFAFPAPAMNADKNHEIALPVPLGTDMWLSSHAIDLSPLSQDCQCYACTNHHRAYVQHLLAAKEMLGWVLLQIHNHHVLDLFFEGIRRSISADVFEDDIAAFARVYESGLPQKTGQGPRVRGYQYKSEGPGEAKRNPVTFTVLNDRKEKLAETVTPNEDLNANDLQARGFADTQNV